MKSTAVLLVEGVNIGALRQQQIDHLSGNGTEETKKFRDGKMARGKKKQDRSSHSGLQSESVVRQSLCVSLYITSF